MTVRKIGVDFLGQHTYNYLLKYFKGSSIDLEVHANFDLTNYKIRADLFDGCNSIQIATSNSGGLDSEILITSASQGIFTIHIGKDLTTCFKTDSMIELELEDPDGTPLETRRIPIKLSNQKITWVTPNEAPTPSTPVAGASVRKYSATFTNADLTNGILSVTHSLGTELVSVMIYDQNNKQITPDITLTSINALIADLSAWGTLTGTWSIIVLT